VNEDQQQQRDSVDTQTKVSGSKVVMIGQEIEIKQGKEGDILRKMDTTKPKRIGFNLPRNKESIQERWLLWT
jgi:hypothetical protein